MKRDPASMASDPARWRHNRRHWESTTDAQNLSGRGAAGARRALALASTVDVRRAISALGPLRGRTFLALGDGPALMAVALARAGARVIVVDISLPRVRAGRELARRLGLSGSISFIVGAAEALPLASASMHCAATKSVLIHTQLAPACRELARVLPPGGRIALIEPTPHHPLVELYRRTLAPAAWREITTYMGRRELAIMRRTLGGAGIRTRVEHSHLLGFLAAPFAFALHAPRVFHGLETALCAVDRALFRLIPPLARTSWFVILHGRRSADGAIRRP